MRTVGKQWLCKLKHCHRESWSTHFAWNSYTPVHCSLCTLVHGQTSRLLCTIVYCVFVNTCGAHRLLGTVTRLFNPASVHLYMDKPADDLLLTNPRVVWEHPYSDQWEPSQHNQTDPRRPIAGLEKCHGEGDSGKANGSCGGTIRLEMKKASLLRRAALKTCLQFINEL
jgi:hypothetical protein